MPVNRIRILIPTIYVAAVLLSVVLWDDAVAAVAIIGAILVGLAYVFIRPEPGVGRQRNRQRNRG